MPSPHVVTLPRGLDPHFPEVCVFSGEPSLGSRVAFLTRDGSYGSALWAGWHLVHAPCRPGLQSLIHLRQAWQFLRTVVVGLGGMVFAALVLFSRYRGFVQGILSLAFTAVLIGAVVFWERTHPYTFDVSRHGDAVDYEFLNSSYASEFATLNNATEVKPPNNALQRTRFARR